MSHKGIGNRNIGGTIKKVIRDEDWLLNKVTPITESGCWIWDGYCNKKTGYGMYRIGGGAAGYKGRNIAMHRMSWEIHNGDIPEGLCVLHTCDVRECCNPDHLWLGTHQDNMDDARQKGRMIGPVGKTPWNKGYKGYRLKSRLLSEDKDNILRLIKEEDISLKDIAIKYNITIQAVSYYRRMIK